MRRSLASLVLAGLTTCSGAEAADPELPAAWRRGDVVVDGRSDDWSGRLVPMGDSPVLVAVQNDGSYLYLCLRTSDEATRRVILGTGLSIFLDASGRRDRDFGVRYPVGRLSAAPGVRERGGAPRPPREDSSYTEDMKAVRGLELAAAGAELEILKKEKGDRGRMSLAEALPLMAALGEEDGAIVVELRVPLAFSLESPHAIETAPGRAIALGLETKAPKEERGAGFSFGGAGGGMGPGGPGGPGGGRGPGGGAPMDAGPSGPKAKLGKPLKVWATVPLAPLAEPAPQEAVPEPTSPSM